MVFQLVPQNSACNLITEDCKPAIECGMMVCAISSSRIPSHDWLFYGAINLEGNF